MAILFGSLLAALLSYLFSNVCLAKKESNSNFDFNCLALSFKNRIHNCKHLIRLTISLVLTLIFFLLTSLVFTRISNPGEFFLGVFTYFIAYASHLAEFLLQKILKKEPTSPKKQIKCGILSIFMLAIGILEVFAFNPRATKGDVDPINLSTDYVILNNGLKQLPNGDILFVDDEASLTIAYSNTDNSDINIEIHYEGDSFVSYVYPNINVGDQRYLINNYAGGDTADPNYSIYRIGTSNFDSLTFDFAILGGGNGSLRITGFSVNVAIPLIVSPIRLGILSLFSLTLIFLPEAYKGLTRKDLPDSSDDKKASVRILLGGGLIFTFILSIILINKATYFVNYPFSESTLYEQNCYQQLFDAILKGQFNLDIIPDPKLQIIENPYDPILRMTSAIDFLWDRAYYNNQYFVYYGIAPLFVTVFPLYYLTGMVALDPAIMLLGGVFMAVGFLLMLHKITKVFAPECPARIKNTLIVITLFSSGLFTVLGTRDSFYHIPYIYGLAFMAFFIYFVLLAKENEERRWLYLMLSGIAFIGIIQSRPNLCLVLIIVAPMYLKMLFTKEGSKTKMKNFLPMTGVLCLGAVWTCIYNYSRFENIFEFGQFYQLTVTDPTTLKLEFKGLYNTLYHFFLKPPTGGLSAGGLLEFNTERLLFEYHNYQQGMIGALYNPFFLLIFLLPIVFKKKDGFNKIFFAATIPLVAFIITWMTYCYAGVCPRYISDYYPLLGICSFIVLVMFYSKYKDRPLFKNYYFVGTAVVSIIGLYFGTSILFNNFDGLFGGDALGFSKFFASAFNNYFF